MRKQIKSQHFTSGAAAWTSLATFYNKSWYAVLHLIYYIIAQKTYLIRALFCGDVNRIPRLRRVPEHSDAAFD